MAARRLKATAISPPISRPVPAARPAAADPLPPAPAPAPPAAPAAPAAPAPPTLTSPALPRALAVTTARSAAGQQRPEYVRHDPAVPVVGGLTRRVDPHDRRELLAVRGHRHLARRLAPVHGLDSGDVEDLVPGEPEGARVLARLELQRQHAHPDQVRPVYPLERLDQDRADAEQRGALGGPVARRARPVLLAAEHDQRRALLQVRAGRLVDRGLRPLRQLERHAALGARGELVAQPDVRERAADHHLVVAAPRAVGVEVTPLDPVAGQVLPGRGV